MITTASAASYEIRFQSLHQGRGMTFPCDSKGAVNLDELSDRGRANYLFARAMVGRDFAWPVVRAAVCRPEAMFT